MRLIYILPSISWISPLVLLAACSTQESSKAETLAQDNLATVDTGSDNIITDDTATSTEVAEDAPIEIIGPLPVSGQQEAIVETLKDSIETAISLHGCAHLLQQDGLLSFMDETTSEEILLGNPELFDGAAIGPGDSVLTLDGELFIFDGQWLEPSPLNELLPIPIEKVEGNENLLWLQGANTLYRFASGTLVEIQPPEQQEVRLFTASRQGIAAMVAPQLILFDGQSETVTVTDYRNDLSPKSMTFDSGENLWLSDGSQVLYHRNAEREWSGLDAGSPILGVHGNASSETTWIRTEDAVIHHRGGIFHSVEVPEGEWLDVDEWGRILLRSEAGLQRLSMERTVAISGILKNGTLEGPTTIAYAPTDWASLESIQAWVDEHPLAIVPDTLESTLDPNDFATGEHHLRIIAAGPEGHTITEVPFQIGELPDVKWENELELITAQHCNQCHGDGSFMPLYTAGQWEQTIDLIISEVVTNSMPKGGPYLSDAEIQMIRGWKNGGFQ